jgi:hypothetical protein
MNEGLMIMRFLLAKDMFMNYLGASINTVAVYTSAIASPWLIKMVPGVIIDARVLPKRKYYLIVCASICAILQAMVALRVFESHLHNMYLLLIYNIGASMLDVTIESIII